MAANLYYAQPLLEAIGQSMALSAEGRGLAVTLTQVGYVVGLLLLVPLADMVENRRLVLLLLAGSVVGLTAAALLSNGPLFLAAMLVVGLCSVGIQVLVPYAAHLAPEAIRGRVVGNVMSGLMLGIMVARPLASFIADVLSWRAVYGLSALVMVLLMVAHRLVLPRRDPTPKLRHADLLMSLVHLFVAKADTRRRALAHAGLFAAFSLFWTTIPLRLLAEPFNLSLAGVGWVALAGAAGVIAAPIAGRVADRGWGRPAGILSMVMVALSFPMTVLAPDGSTLALVLAVVAAVFIDFGLTMNLVVNQRVLFNEAPEIRGRLNGLFMATFYTGGAVGSLVGTWTLAHWGWLGAAGAGFLMPALALAYFLARVPARRP
jgi:predicted MFS family arabinose efflux permease